MELHTKFTKPTKKKKVAKIVEEILIEEGHSRERESELKELREMQ